MPNPKGKNGVHNGTWPSDDILCAALESYARGSLKHAERLRRLEVDYGLIIKETKLKQLQKKFNISSVYKAPEYAYAAQLILNEAEKDTYQENGPNAVKSILAKDGILIPRQVVRQVMRDNFPDGADIRRPGRRKIKRTQLTSIGVFADVAADGHDKANALALQMGSLNFPIYGFRDRFSGMILHMQVVPNDRLATTIGHVYLDFIETFQTIPLRLTVDKGSETGEEYAMQVVLRRKFAPDIDEEIHPSFIALKSTSNTTIETCWRWLRKFGEKNFVQEVKRGFNDGIFNPNNELHVNLANWIWPAILQNLVNDFVEYFNNHRTRKQKDKIMPSGTTPLNIFMDPEIHGGGYYGIKVSQDAINELRADIPISREQALQFVDRDFTNRANGVWELINSPQLTIQNGVAAKKEVLVCGGAVASPQILLLSGLGPRNELEKKSIRVVKHLPAVGKNFADHISAGTFNLQAKPGKTYDYLNNPVYALLAVAQWYFTGTGVISELAAPGAIFIRSADDPCIPRGPCRNSRRPVGPNAPDLEILWFPLTVVDNAMTKTSSKVKGVTLSPVAIQPKSAGEVTLATNSAWDQPIIDANFFDDDNDMKVIIRGTRLIIKLAHTEPFASMLELNPKPDHPFFWPGCADPDKITDGEPREWVRKNACPVFHPGCSCRMGISEDSSVVNNKLQVHGVDSLRIIDASIFPTLVSGHPCAPVVAVAEKASDMIKQQYGL